MTDFSSANGDRRKLLSFLGLGAVGAFVAPAILQVSAARASSGSSGGGGGEIGRAHV